MKSDSTDNQEKKPRKETPESPLNTEMPICGVVMPIASMGGEYTENHWKDVFNIVKEAAKAAGYNAQLVSHSDSVGVIHNDIVQNLYQNEIVVCDVSGKNPNVMFELGMRLTFDKPTIIIKDDYTNYSFDISSIRHEEYPRDLRYNLIQDFKEKLAKRIRETILAYKDNNYTTFLKHFKNLQIKAPELETKEVSINEAVLAKLDNISNRISKIEHKETSNSINNVDPSILKEVFNIQANGDFNRYIKNVFNNNINVYLEMRQEERIFRFFEDALQDFNVSLYHKIKNQKLYQSIYPYLQAFERKAIDEIMATNNPT